MHIRHAVRSRLEGMLALCILTSDAKNNEVLRTIFFEIRAPTDTLILLRLAREIRHEASWCARAASRHAAETDRAATAGEGETEISQEAAVEPLAISSRRT